MGVEGRIAKLRPWLKNFEVLFLSAFELKFYFHNFCCCKFEARFLKTSYFWPLRKDIFRRICQTELKLSRFESFVF